MFGASRVTELEIAAKICGQPVEGLQDDARSLARGLSLGDRRFLEVARAMATGASVLLLDEVASGLDPVDRNIRRLVHRHWFVT